MAKRILGFILSALGFIIIIFLKRYLENTVPYPKLVLPIGGILLLVGSILIGMSPTYRQLKAEEKEKEPEQKDPN